MRWFDDGTAGSEQLDWEQREEGNRGKGGGSLFQQWMWVVSFPLIYHKAMQTQLHSVCMLS